MLRLPSRRDITELKGVAQPPKEIKVLLEALMHLMAGVLPSVEVDKQGLAKDTSWQCVKRQLLPNPLLIAAVYGYGEHLECGRVSEANLERVRQLRCASVECFDAVNIAQKMQSAAGLCNWINDVIDYPFTPLAMRS